jgi:hypothetical protein
MPVDYEHSTSSRAAIGFVIGPGVVFDAALGELRRKTTSAVGAFGKLRQRPCPG